MSDPKRRTAAKGISAPVARIIFIAGVILTISLGVAGFYYALKQLGTFAQETNTLSNQSQSSTKTLQELQVLEQYMADNSTDVERAANITSSDEAYQYQDDFVRELSNLGRQSGVDITNFSFGGGGEGGAAGATTAPPAGQGAATPLADGSVATAPTAGGALKSVSSTVKIESPLPYRQFLTFLKLIESNPKRMQITSVSLSGSSVSGGSTSEGGPDGESARAPRGSVTTEDLEIKVYLK